MENNLHSTQPHLGKVFLTITSLVPSWKSPSSLTRMAISGHLSPVLVSLWALWPEFKVQIGPANSFLTHVWLRVPP
jgi:hypothetical protein